MRHSPFRPFIAIPRWTPRSGFVLLTQLAALAAMGWLVWRLRVSSPLYALGATVLLVIGITRLLYSQWAELDSAAAPSLDRAYTWFRASPYCVALGCQTSLVAVWMGAPALAAALLCTSVATLTLLCLAAGVCRTNQPDNWRKSLLDTALTLIYALGLTIAGGVVSLHSDSQASPEPDSKTRSNPHESITKLYQPSRALEIADKSYAGVILWPEVKTTDRVLAAPPRSWALSPLPPVPRTPARIPFSGQYWMYKPPQIAPPSRSYFRRASPLALSFFTTDQRPMSMEAVQKLNHPLDLGCCRAIQIAISNADRYPGTIALELLLIDDQFAQSLGKRDVLSRPTVKPLDQSVIPAAEVLEFPVPPGARIRRFEGIRVLFHRSPFRIDRSAKISIEHFVLVP